MGATVIGYCRDITDDLIDGQPGFWNDCKAWGDWMAERENHPAVKEALVRLGCGALLTFVTDGVPEEEVDWVTPKSCRVPPSNCGSWYCSVILIHR